MISIAETQVLQCGLFQADGRTYQKNKLIDLFIWNYQPHGAVVDSTL
jgi:hypothetical protein